MMERLTYRGSEIMTEDGWFKPSYSCYSTERIIEKLAEYEDLEEQGLLLRSPIKVGDTVYVLCKNIVTEKQVYDVQYRGGITYQKGQRWYVNIGGLAYYEMDFGKTVFLTQEEAEQKLKEKEMGIRPSYSNYSTKRIIERLTEYEDAEKQGLLLRLPCKVGDTVYAICTCEAVDTVLDGTLYGSNGGFGTATGYYCPYELSDKCPHIDADDCDECKNIEAVFEDTIDYINITEYETIIGLHNTNLCVTVDEIGKTVFLTQEEAEQKLKEMESD